MRTQDLKIGQEVGHIKNNQVRPARFKMKDKNGKFLFDVTTKLGPLTITITATLDEDAVLREIEPIACCS